MRINERLAEMNGRSVADHLGRSVREVLPALASTLEPIFRRVLGTGQPVMDLEVTGETSAAPGIQRHWLVSYYRVRDVDGSSLGPGGVVVQITRRITTSAERMGRMISDLLDFTRGRLGRGIPIHPRPANLRHICRHVVEELEAGHPERQLRLSAEGRFQGAWDPDRLAQVFGNLGKNALEYSPEGTPVDFVLRDEGDAVSVEVHNEGPPIAAEALSSVFEPFQRAVDAEHHASSGLGLGLFIVQQIVTAHGGTVEVRSTKVEGTSFTVRLPRHAAGSEETPVG